MTNPIVQMSEYLNMYRYHHQIPGFVASVMQENRIIFKKGFGRTRHDYSGAMVKSDSPFSIQQLSEIFTSIALLHLQENTDFKLDDPIQKYVPDYQGKPITTRHLLNHTAGFPKDYFLTPLLDKDFVSYTKDMPEYRLIYKKNAFMQDKLPPIYTREDVSQYISTIDLENEPGKVYRYFPDGYVIAANILEKVSGETYESYVEKQIISALQLKGTSMNKPNGNSEKMMHYYLNTTGEPMSVPVPNNKIGIPMGFMYSTIDDLTTLLLEIMHPAGKILSADSLHQLFPKEGKEAGIGWKMNNQMIEKVGSYLGVSSYIAIEPEQSIGVILLCNMDHIPLRNPAKKLIKLNSHPL